MFKRSSPVIKVIEQNHNKNNWLRVYQDVTQYFQCTSDTYKEKGDIIVAFVTFDVISDAKSDSGSSEYGLTADSRRNRQGCFPQ